MKETLETFAEKVPGLERLIDKLPNLGGDAQEEMTQKEGQKSILIAELVEPVVSYLATQEMIAESFETLAVATTEANMQKTILTKVGELTGELMGTVAKAFDVDPNKILGAFQFNMTEEELMRLFETMMSSGVDQNAETNLSAAANFDA